MRWLLDIVAAIISLVTGLIRRKNQMEQVAEVKDEQIKAAMDRPSVDGVDERLRNGKF